MAATRAYGVEEVGKDIALPATFVVGADGKIVLAYVGDSPRDRPETDALLNAL